MLIMLLLEAGLAQGNNDSLKQLETMLKNHFEAPSFTRPEGCLNHNFHTVIDSIFDKRIPKELKNNGLTESSLIWPKCEVYKQCDVFPKDERQFQNAYFWINHYVRKARSLFEEKKVVIYEDPDVGDHLIAGCEEKNGQYFQFIDGKTLTFLIQADIEMNDTTLARKQILDVVSQWINYEELDCGPALVQKIVFRGTNDEALFGEVKSTWKCEEYVHGYPKNYIWTNGEIIIIDVFKIRAPQLLLYSHPAQKVLGSLPASYNKPFVRFADSANVDFKKEIYNFFPALKDSLYKWLDQSENHFPVGFENSPRPVYDE